ncbi:MAG: hypothetical protein ABJA81_03940 [Nocardioidaceae bacterium]
MGASDRRNYLLDRSKNTVERLETTFDAFAADLLDGLASSASSAPDAGILEREVQLACTHAMLTCLDRGHRIAYILGEIFEVDSAEGGFICEVSPVTYRKRLSRARARMRLFLNVNCGLVSPDAACHCSKRVDVAVRLGRVDRQRLEFTDVTVSVNDEMVRFHEAADLLRCLPPAKVPTSTIDVVTNLIRNSTAASAATSAAANPQQSAERPPDPGRFRLSERHVDIRGILVYFPI